MTTENTPDAPPVELYKALMAAKRSIKEIRKTGYNKHQSFYFRTYDDLVGAIEPALSANGLMIIPDTISVERDSYTSAKGTVQHVCELTVRYTVIHESGQTMSMVMSGTGWDTGDKALTKAYTYARKTMLLQVFGYVDEETPDPDSVTVEPGESPASIAQEAEKQADRVSRNVDDAETASDANSAFSAYKGWWKRQRERLPERVLGASVSRERSGTQFDGTLMEYMNALGGEIKSLVDAK